MVRENTPTDKGAYAFLIDDLRYFEAIDHTRRQILAAGWILFREKPGEPFRIRVDAPEEIRTEILYVERKDVADMYDSTDPEIGFRVLLTAGRDFQQICKELRISAVCGDTEVALLRLPLAQLDEIREENVHATVDQFALNGTVVRMAGWGYLSDLYEEYRPLTVWAEDVKTGGTAARAEYMLRPDIISLFAAPEDKERQWGFFLLLDMKDHPECELCFGEDGCKKKWRISLSDLQREKREKRRRYRSKAEMWLLSDPLQKEDDRYYKEHLSREAYHKLIEDRLTYKDVDYDVWMRRHVVVSEKELARQRKQQERFPIRPLISIAVPAFRTPERFLREMIESVQAQTYPRWELCIADGSLDGSLTGLLKEYVKDDPRVRYLTLPENYGISGNTNEAIRLSTGDYVALLDHDDVITPDALYEFVKYINETGADCIYSDEDKADYEMEDYFEPHFKPDFNLDMLRSCNYICHFFMVRRDVLERAGLFREEYDGSQDFDFILRCTSEAEQVGHIRKMLYHWRSHAASTAMNPENKMYCYTAGRNAILADLVSHGFSGMRVENYTRLGYYEPIYALHRTPRISVFTTEETAESLEHLRKSGKFYANAQILAATEDLTGRLMEAEGEYFLFLHGNVRETSEDWLVRLAANAARPEVGVIGAMVYNELGRISASGKIIRPNGELLDLFKGLLKEEPGYAAHALMQQDVSAVSDKCLMIRRDVFEAAKGYELMSGFGMERAALLCKRVLELKKLVVYTPFVQIKEKETPENEDILIRELATGESDPHYSPGFDPEGAAFTLVL